MKNVFTVFIFCNGIYRFSHGMLCGLKEGSENAFLFSKKNAMANTQVLMANSGL